jgi:hypothetical protein
VGRVKKRQARGKGNIRAPSGANNPNQGHPVFCLRYLRNGWGVADCENTDRAKLLAKLATLSKLTWSKLMSMPRESAFEKIPIAKMPGDPPTPFSEETHTQCFRFSGAGRAHGFRRGDTLHLV